MKHNIILECLKSRIPLWPSKNTCFFENYEFSVRFSVFSRSRFLRGLRESHGFQTIYKKVLKHLGEDGFSMFWTKKGHFLRKQRRGGKNSPPTTERTFLTPPQIGLRSLRCVWERIDLSVWGLLHCM